MDQRSALQWIVVKCVAVQWIVTIWRLGVGKTSLRASQRNEDSSRSIELFLHFHHLILFNYLKHFHRTVDVDGDLDGVDDKDDDDDGNGDRPKSGLELSETLWLWSAAKPKPAN